VNTEYLNETKVSYNNYLQVQLDLIEISYLNPI